METNKTFNFDFWQKKKTNCLISPKKLFLSKKKRKKNKRVISTYKFVDINEKWVISFCKMSCYQCKKKKINVYQTGKVSFWVPWELADIFFCKNKKKREWPNECLFFKERQPFCLTMNPAVKFHPSKLCLDKIFQKTKKIKTEKV